jgi:condensin-2 complex subunit G2
LHAADHINDVVAHLQNLMLAAIHGSSVGLVGNIIKVLGELHRSKRLGGAGSVDSMLVRLYEPILFRALAAANAGVRRNALQLLLDAFPLLVSGAEHRFLGTCTCALVHS